MATMMTMTTTMVVETVGEIANLKEQARFKTSLPPGRRRGSGANVYEVAATQYGIFFSYPGPTRRCTKSH